VLIHPELSENVARIGGPCQGQFAFSRNAEGVRESAPRTPSALRLNFMRAMVTKTVTLISETCLRHRK
jgi:hypothetical protein